LRKPLSAVARVYVTGVIIAGAALFAACLPLARFDQPILFLVLLVLSSATATLKVQLPLLTSSSTMSVSYAVDFASLLLLGPNETMFVASISAWSQCVFRMKTRNPVYRTLFSMACLVVTVQAAGQIYDWLGGSHGRFSARHRRVRVRSRRGELDLPVSPREAGLQASHTCAATPTRALPPAHLGRPALQKRR